MPGERVLSTQDNDKEEIKLNQKKKVEIDELSDRVCYFSLAGNLALEAFNQIKYSTFSDEKRRRNKLKRDFTQRLFLAVLMFDKVVMHCSDPLRSEIVLEVLEENLQWIKEGRILFIFSHHINDIRSDFKEYIESKINEYSEGFHSEKEAESLKQKHINDRYYERVICLLENANYLVLKSNKKGYTFDKLVIKDLTSQVQAENVIIDSNADLPQVLSLNLTLFQLLHMRHLRCNEDEEKEVGKFVFPKDIVDDVIEKLKHCLKQGNTISRSAIVDLLEEEIRKKESKISKNQKKVLDAVSLRMDILYCKMNSGEQLILEFHPAYENGSNYQLDCFNEYLKIIAETKKAISLTYEIVDKILCEEDLDYFRMLFLNCMADMREHMKLSQINSNAANQYGENLLELFNVVAVKNEGIRKRKPMKSIKEILKEAI